MKKIYIASDHNGYNMVLDLCSYYANKDITLINLNDFYDKGDDYPDVAYNLSKKVVKDDCFGILICGSGIGMSIMANKIKGIRASRCVDKNDCYLTRVDNDANVLCISSSLMLTDVINMINTFIETPFSKDERHIRRVDKIHKFENGEYNGL